MRERGARWPAMLCLTLLTAVGGCHSAFVQTTIVNQGDTDLKLLEVDYPSASFGAETLAAHAEYHYRFKIQGSGAVKLQFAEASGKLQTSTGPDVAEGQEGSLRITIQADHQVVWAPKLAAAK